MPTGYTADIAKGISFTEYALGCAKAFGACISMRDEPASKPIPERFEPTDYYRKSMDEARERLLRLEGMSPEMIAEEAHADRAKAVARHHERIAEKLELRRKYDAMLLEVYKYVPPTTDHVGFRQFMVEQIETSMSDCSTEYCVLPEAVTPEQWRRQQIEAATKDIANAAKNHAEELARVEYRNRWIAALRLSLFGGASLDARP